MIKTILNVFAVTAALFKNEALKHGAQNRRRGATCIPQALWIVKPNPHNFGGLAAVTAAYSGRKPFSNIH